MHQPLPLAAIFSTDPTELMLRVPVVLLALTVHEFCHAYFAYRMGDPTAYRLGRCSLNPLRHLEPLGTLCLLFAPIGWAKPVPINPVNFHNWRKGVLVSTAAGPLSNAAQAILFAFLLRVHGYVLPHLPLDNPQMFQFMFLMDEMFTMAVYINVGLAVFNCIPLYPLDGFHITMQLMRPESQHRFAESARFGPFAILALVLVGNYDPRFNFLGQMIRPPAEFLFHHVAGTL